MPTPDADARTVFLRRLIDDAGLFPPARLPMADAIAGHVRARRGPHAWMQGRFLCPASRLPELAATLDGDPGAVPTLGVILDRRASEDWETAVSADLEAIAAFSAIASDVRVDVVETALPAADEPAVGQAIGALLRRLSPGVTPYLEVPGGAATVVRAVAAARADADGSAPAAKIRCGGLSPEAFPSPDQVAAFLTACASAGVPAKATAGLHHPIRHHDDANGWWEHGFVNVVGAATLAANGEPATVVTHLLAEDDPGALGLDEAGFSWRGRAWGPQGVAAGRALLVAYGSCSFDEPVEGLAALGMLP